MNRDVFYDNPPLGRPTKYKREYAEGIIKYFQDAVVVERIEDDPSGRGGTSTHFEALRVPGIIGYAAQIGVHRDTLYEWAKAVYPKGHKRFGKLKHPEFSDALSRAQAMEEAVVFEYGLAGRLDRSLAGMYFTNKLGFTASSRLDITSAGERIKSEPIIISTIAARAQPDASTEGEASQSS